MTGRPGINLMNSAAAVVLYIALGIWIVPTHGALGMAVVDAAVTAIINTVRVIEARFIVGIHPFGKSLLKPVTAASVALVVAGAILTIAGAGSLPAVIALAVGGIVYVAVLVRLGLDPEERQVWDAISRKTSALDLRQRLHASLVGKD